jgi:hypothetical protein
MNGFRTSTHHAFKTSDLREPKKTYVTTFRFVLHVHQDEGIVMVCIQTKVTEWLILWQERRTGLVHQIIRNSIGHCLKLKKILDIGELIC